MPEGVDVVVAVIVAARFTDIFGISGLRTRGAYRGSGKIVLRACGFRVRAAFADTLSVGTFGVRSVEVTERIRVVVAVIVTTISANIFGISLFRTGGTYRGSGEIVHCACGFRVYAAFADTLSVDTFGVG